MEPEWYLCLVPADQAIQQLDSKGNAVESHFQYIPVPGKVNVIDGSYTCSLEDLNLSENAIVVQDGQYNLNIDAIRQIQEAKVEIQQDGYNYTIEDFSQFKEEPVYTDEYASEVNYYMGSLYI